LKQHHFCKIFLVNLTVVRRKTIYEYHKVELKKEAVANGTAIYFSALPTCVSLKGCEACISNSIGFEVIMHLSGMKQNKNLRLFTKTVCVVFNG
jgi:hypothetical protein